MLINTAAFGRTFFVTEECAIGLGPPSANPGDEEWIFFGGKAPFTVRPLNGDDEGFYQFISDCYLDGVMFGESFENPVWFEENHWKSRSNDPMTLSATLFSMLGADRIMEIRRAL